MKCTHSTRTHTKTTRQNASAFILFTFLISSASILNGEAITVQGPGRISLPNLVVAATPQQVYSGTLTLDLSNETERNGWLLSGSIAEGALVGSETGARIPAELTFKSVRWISDGNGSTVGIKVYADGKQVEADPGFGIGKYRIEFEVRYDVPAFPTTDYYNCISTFIVQ